MVTIERMSQQCDYDGRVSRFLIVLALVVAFAIYLLRRFATAIPHQHIAVYQNSTTTAQQEATEERTIETTTSNSLTFRKKNVVPYHGKENTSPHTKPQWKWERPRRSTSVYVVDDVSIDVQRSTSLTEQSSTSQKCDNCVGVERGYTSALFRWYGGGEEVYLTGSFNNWRIFVPMQRVRPATDGGKEWHEARLLLPRGHHEYKFVVDHRWRYDEAKPTTPAHRLGHATNNVCHVDRETTII